ncbi:MAG: phosphonopyruvate decarboxylase [Kiritimatiellae bacterium]|nr:phosphonopyruvate decarboxylase [Kiritimatiellia bacterium]
MLDQTRVFDELDKAGVRFYAGVPDSYLNGFCNHALAHFPDRTVIAANEGNAVGIAAGHWFATGDLPLVYMQNSGIGNAVNPLASLADVHVYAVPMLLLVGWRGQPGTGDWPQHGLQGEATIPLMDVLHIPHAVLSDDDAAFAATVRAAAAFCKVERKPYALIAPKGVMAGDKANNRDGTYPMGREEAIAAILDHMPPDTVYSATTGRATRELFFLRERRGETKARDYLNVGAMGHASSVALGIAMAKPDRPVVVLDGDCAAMMHLGAMTMASKTRVPNLLHAVLNNGAHESVGGQPSAGHLVDFTKIAEACGYRTVGRPATTKDELVSALAALRASAADPDGRPAFLDIRIHKGLSGKLPPLDFSHRAAIDALRADLQR